MTKRLYPPTYWDREEVAYHLCIEAKTVDEWVRTGKLPRGRIVPGTGKPLWVPAEIAGLLEVKEKREFEIKAVK